MKKPNKYKSLLLLAPTSSGKTSLLFDIQKKFSWEVLVVTPLRALADEINKRGEIRAETAESCLKFLKDETFDGLVVIDEAHLWNHWGNSFRPGMWEVIYLLLNRGLPLILLTATMEEKFICEWNELTEWAGYEFNILDLGNFQMKYCPAREVSYRGLYREAFKRRMLHEVELGGRSLIFCRTRHEVYKLVREFNEFGFKSKGCVGGESKDFISEDADIIVATTVLSHGVNLGEINKVFITYEILEEDFYLQMKARGGRRGESFEVYCFQSEITSTWQKLGLWVFDRYLQLFYS